MSSRETNPLWRPIAPERAEPEQTVQAYARALPVRLCRSQRYSLVVTEPRLEETWS